MARVRRGAVASGSCTSTATASPGTNSCASIAAIPRSHTFTARPGTVSGIPDRSTVTSSTACIGNRGPRLRDVPLHPITRVPVAIQSLNDLRCHSDPELRQARNLLLPVRLRVSDPDRASEETAICLAPQFNNLASAGK